MKENKLGLRGPIDFWTQSWTQSGDDEYPNYQTYVGEVMNTLFGDEVPREQRTGHYVDLFLWFMEEEEMLGTYETMFRKAWGGKLTENDTVVQLIHETLIDWVPSEFLVCAVPFQEVPGGPAQWLALDEEWQRLRESVDHGEWNQVVEYIMDKLTLEVLTGTEV